MPSRPCIRCGRLVRKGKVCPIHKGKSPSSAATDGAGWTKLRAAVRGRDGYRCRRCGSTDGCQAHHVVPVAEGGRNELSNLILLCRRCHAATFTG